MATEANNKLCGGGDNHDYHHKLILEHRKSIHEYNPNLAEAVAFLRKTRNLKLVKYPLTSCPEDLQPISLKEITKVDNLYEGRVLRVKISEPPKGYQFEYP